MIFNSALTRTAGGGAAATIDQFDNLSLPEVLGFKDLAALWYSGPTACVFSSN